jgi:class 3 adenylate cyclase
VGLGDSTIKRMSVLYSDMRSFTARLEKMDPRQSIDFINGYIRHVEAPILEHGGFIDSFAGDAILALFDRTSDATLRAALGMLRALEAFNRERGFAPLQAVNIGIGVNTGTLILGTIGGQNRIKCGVVGDSVNVAARIEGLTKLYGTPLLIGDSSFEDLAEPRSFCVREVDEVLVKGRSEPVTIYEVFDHERAELKSAKLESLSTYSEALQQLRSGRFSEALPLLEQCRELLPHDAVVRHHLARCQASIGLAGLAVSSERY